QSDCTSLRARGLPACNALRCLAVERRRVGRGAAPFGDPGDDDDAFVEVAAHANRRAHRYVFRRFRARAVVVDLAAFDRELRLCAGLVEPRRPQPSIEPRMAGVLGHGGMISSNVLNEGYRSASRGGRDESGCVIVSRWPTPNSFAQSRTVALSSTNNARAGVNGSNAAKRCQNAVDSFGGSKS